MSEGFTGERSFLSNFHHSPIEHEGVQYPTVEHAFQAAKTLDPQIRQIIARLPSPGAAKQAGRKLTLRGDWEAVKDQVMLELLRAKFSQPAFEGRLLATGDDELVEDNWWHDQYWGSCYCPTHVISPGCNRLGELLMQVRAELSA
jgi:ribA/ribD-fused uncharacterized protein